MRSVASFVREIAKGVVLELRCPSNVDGISIDPEPNWNFDTLVSEINSLEKKLNASSRFPLTLTKTTLRDVHNGNWMERKARGFVMRVSDDEMETVEDESEEEDHSQRSIVAKRFAFDELYLSDDSDDELFPEAESYLMDKMGLAEGALYELTNDHQIEVKEEIRNQVSAVEAEITSEIEASHSAIARVEKYRETRKEVERKLDLQYQRKVAEALDSHLTAIQREHELKSQIEERKIRSDAAHEETKRRERVLREEKIRQEKARAEAEMQAKVRAEEAKKEAERKAAKAAAEKEAAERKAAEQKAAEEKAIKERAVEISKRVAGSSETLNAQAEGSMGKVTRAAGSALTLEQQRLNKLKELEDMTLESRSNKDFSNFERHISRVIRQIRGTKDNVRAKAGEIVKILNNPNCQSIGIAAFAEKVVSSSENSSTPPFAYSYVIVLVTSQFPQAMDILLAKLHKACIYTVPKHITYSESVFESKEAYQRAIGFRETDGKIENVESYLKRVECYMRLYGALIQTEIGRLRNLHGLEEGWTWLARFLNRIPANKVTATALNAFLQVAGFALYRRYKSQFLKILNAIREHFLAKLRIKQDSSDLGPMIEAIQAYLDDKKYLQEPEGRSLQSNLLSRDMAPDADYQESYNHSNRYYWS